MSYKHTSLLPTGDRISRVKSLKVQREKKNTFLVFKNFLARLFRQRALTTEGKPKNAHHSCNKAPCKFVRSFGNTVSVTFKRRRYIQHNDT
jgi:hypothetical protein